VIIILGEFYNPDNKVTLWEI